MQLLYTKFQFTYIFSNHPRVTKCLNSIPPSSQSPPPSLPPRGEHFPPRRKILMKPLGRTHFFTKCQDKFCEGKYKFLSKYISSKIVPPPQKKNRPHGCLGTIAPSLALPTFHCFLKAIFVPILLLVHSGGRKVCPAQYSHLYYFQSTLVVGRFVWFNNNTCTSCRPL